MWNVRSSSEWQLYVILDRAALRDRDPVEVTSQTIRGGADALQLRDTSGTVRWLLEQARRMLPLTRAAGIPLIINDRADAANAVDADGVHLGQEDLSVADARRFLGADRLIGKSTHSIEQAVAAEREGADYIGFGPVFPTPTKPDYGSIGTADILHVRRQLRIPMVCIGGIDQMNVSQVLGAGASCVAVVRAVCASDNPECSTRELKAVFQRVARSTPSPL